MTRTMRLWILWKEHQLLSPENDSNKFVGFQELSGRTVRMDCELAEKKTRALHRPIGVLPSGGICCIYDLNSFTCVPR